MCNSRQTGYLIAATFAILLSANIAAAQNEKLQLYFFTNAGCPPCRLVEPELEKLCREGYSVMKIDTTVHPDWTRRFRVTKTPTVVLVSGNTVVASHCGVIDANTIKGWYRKAAPPKSPRRTSSKSSINPPTDAAHSTVHKGTFKPANDVEQLAMQATVRLKIDDPEGTSYATGTVIHTVENQALVLTCGHVFRDSKGRGKISAEYGFLDSVSKTACGELIFYDADERDIGLVAIQTDGSLQPVAIANANYLVSNADSIFSIGCDHGQRPSIRRSKIVGTAKYDGVNKVEIVGRPVNGRSGGGLFTTNGDLIGVCNAAVVDSDEGVYVALDTIHWQFDQANLAHLFRNQATPASDVAAVVKSDLEVRPRRDFDSIPVRNPLADSRPVSNSPNRSNTVKADDQNETELIIVMRRKGELESESWTVANPDPNLVAHLRDMSGEKNQAQENRNRLAQLRQDMPNLPQASGKNYNLSRMRAQSPR